MAADNPDRSNPGQYNPSQYNPDQASGLRAPADADQRKAKPAIVCYKVEQLPAIDMPLYRQAREHLQLIETLRVEPRDALAFEVPMGHFFRIVSVEGPQVGDLNLWNANNLSERFYSGKTRQLHATHITTGDRLWSSLPNLRAMATITHDTLEWYGWDQDGAGVHDVIGTRCDPYTNQLLTQQDYHYCCHSNLTRALSAAKGLTVEQAEACVHDVMNVFMCTGFTLDTHQYFMKASPVRPGDFIEFFAEMDLLAALSTCPGGDCGSSHSDDSTPCFPLQIEIYQCDMPNLAEQIQAKQLPPAGAGYDGKHGL